MKCNFDFVRIYFAGRFEGVGAYMTFSRKTSNKLKHCHQNCIAFDSLPLEVL